MLKTHDCGTLRTDRVGQQVTLAGWVHRRRDHGGIIFIDLRDRSGLVQVVFNPETAPDAYKAADQARPEWVLQVTGLVRPRPEGTTNPNLPTGEIEVLAGTVTVLNPAKVPPFSISEPEAEVDESVRLRYRYLDLRRPEMRENLMRRHRAYQATRAYLTENGFIEVETPYFVKYTPGGARNFLVPSRVHAGSFYALAESPQIFKQLLMVAGFDRYFQIVRCFRDEDTRADRQPEFTQIDIEMSFVEEDDVMAMVEGLLSRIWKDVLGYQVPLPMRRLTWDEAMAGYGSDKPDLRFGLPLADVSAAVKDSEFGVFRNAVAAGGTVKALPVPAKLAASISSRERREDLPAYVANYGAKGLAYIQTGETWTGAPAKFFASPEQQGRLLDAAGAKNGDLLFFAADTFEVVNASLGALRLLLGRKLNLIDEKQWAFAWVRRFPLFERDKETGNLVAAHHPFTSPVPEDLHLLDTDPARVRARAYDITLNGNEIGGGSIRIHNAEVQQRMFKALSISDEEAREKFGFLLEAFQYGAPPHGGIAFGMDRLAMLLAGGQTIRDVIAFPKNQRAQDMMTGAPSTVSERQLKDLHIRVVQ